MTITRANPGGWVLDDLLTPLQANTIDSNTTLAIDGVNGDTKTPTSVINIGGQGLKLTAVGAPGRLQYGSRTVTRVLQCTLWVPPAATSYQMAPDPLWGTGSSLHPDYVKNLTNANPKPEWHICNMPNGATLDKFTIYMTGAAGHAAFPAGAPTMPTATLGYTDITTSANNTNTVATATDTTTPAATFEAYHSFSTSSGIGHVVDTTKRKYYIILSAETGANYIAGDIFYHATGDFIFTDQPEMA
jgi:hypothetical protein